MFITSAAVRDHGEGNTHGEKKKNKKQLHSNFEICFFNACVIRVLKKKESKKAPILIDASLLFHSPVTSKHCTALFPK